MSGLDRTAGEAAVETQSHRARGIADRRLWLMGAYGFVAGLPLPLSGFTFRLWLSEGGVSLAVIGLTANIGLAYSLKFLWAPLLDQPGPLEGLGRRRGWLLLIQPALVGAAVLFALSDPRAAAGVSFAAAALVAFLSASQDIVVDAWRIETFPTRLQGAAMAAYVWGYRTALLISGAGAIASAGRVGWHAALLGVSGLLALGPVVTLLAPEPIVSGRPPVRARFRERVKAAVVGPARDFIARPGAPTILAFVALFKLGEAMAGVMTAPFYRALGFDRNAIALAAGPFSLTATFAGTALGGLLVARLGVGRALLWTGLVQTAAMSMYVVLAYSAGEHHALYATVVVEAFSEGMADAAFITYLSGLCSIAFTATQYALLSSLAAVALRTVGGLSGFLAAALGWKLFYAASLFAAMPAMLVMLRILRRYPPAENRAGLRISRDEVSPARCLAAYKEGNHVGRAAGYGVNMSDTRQDLELRILERAYFLWIEAGRPEGRAEEYYLRACELEAAEGRPVNDRTLDRFVTTESEIRGFTNGSGE